MIHWGLKHIRVWPGGRYLLIKKIYTSHHIHHTKTWTKQLQNLSTLSISLDLYIENCVGNFIECCIKEYKHSMCSLYTFGGFTYCAWGFDQITKTVNFLCKKVTSPKVRHNLKAGEQTLLLVFYQILFLPSFALIVVVTDIYCG